MSTDSVTLTVSERLTSLFDHLGIQRAHVGSAPIGDLVALISARFDSVASVALVNPTRLTADALNSFADRLIIFTGDHGPAADSIARAMRSLEGVELHVAENYDTAIWADYAADHGDSILAPLLDFLARQEAERPATVLSTTEGGVVAGISYSMRGEGPALVLFPASLAPSQWAPITDQLAEHFTVITLGGPHLGYLAVLEDRGQDPSYRRVLRSLLTEVNAGPTDTLLEVGCGSGVNLRWLATENFCAKPLTGMDLNAYFLREAESIAELNGVANLIKWQHGDAEAIPFDDSSFDVILTYTMLEECDANKALAELFRVLKPGGARRGRGTCSRHPCLLAFTCRLSPRKQSQRAKRVGISPWLRRRKSFGTAQERRVHEHPILAGLLWDSQSPKSAVDAVPIDRGPPKPITRGLAQVANRA